MNIRGSGILIHITSLPASHGIGDLGSEAYRFADFLHEANQSHWQILPLNPTDSDFDHSPYHSISAFAFNPLLIGLDKLVESGLLRATDIEPVPSFPEDKVSFRRVSTYKRGLLEKAYAAFRSRPKPHEYEVFCESHAYWLEDYVLFKALKTRYPGRRWNQWPAEVRDRKTASIRSLKRELREEMEKETFLQYIFVTQWFELKKYCNDLGIKIIGDIPIYVNYDSVDLWTHPGLFKLDRQKKPEVVAGVPPDYFSTTGQLWGNPVYRWDVMQKNEYAWWTTRVRHNIELFDMVRIDHFRGLAAFWEVPAGEETAIKGLWVEAPGEGFLRVLIRKNPCLPVIAEDLGVITPDVRELMNRFGIPGMKVLQFAFNDDSPQNGHLPHNLSRRSLYYTGTHDNNTLQGWFSRETDPVIRKRLFRYIGRKVSGDELTWETIRLVMMSVANLSVFPMQDILGLGEKARMNRPATQKGNWRWRLRKGQITPELMKRLGEMTRNYGRG
jgi:4-alpha-glucanotransferase